MAPNPPSRNAQDTVTQARSLCDRGEYEQARKLLSSVPLGDAAYLSARFIVARSFMEQGENKEFLRECERLTTSFPEKAQCFQFLGIAYFQTNRLDEAETAFKKALSLNPKDRSSAENLGIVLDQNGWQREAFAQLRLVLQQYGALTRLGYLALIRNALLLGERRLANDVVRKIHQSAGSDPEFKQLEARNAFAHNDADSGLKLLKSGLRQFPGHAGILADHGVYALSVGDVEKAGSYLRKAIRSDSDHSGAHYVLADMGGGVTCKGNDDRESRLKDIRTGIGNDAVPYLKKAELGFAAGKILDSLKRYDDAFEAYDSANKMIWARLSATAEGLIREFEGAKDLCRRVLSNHIDDVDPAAGEGMVYLVGMPRSGTTLLEQMLSGLKEVMPGGETGEINAIVQQIPRILEEPEGNLDILEKATAKDIRKISDRFIGQFRSQVSPGQWRTNKDMQLFLHLGLIRVLFPAAKVIHCRRHPVDTCVSAYFQFFKLYHQQFSFDLVSLARYYRAYHDLMAFWRDHLPMDILEFDYEHLTEDSKSALKPVVDFCGMEWSDDILNYEKSGKTVKTASIWQVRQKLNRNSVERWRRYEKHLQPLLENLGDLSEG